MKLPQTYQLIDSTNIFEVWHNKLIFDSKTGHHVRVDGKPKIYPKERIFRFYIRRSGPRSRMEMVDQENVRYYLIK